MSISWFGLGDTVNGCCIDIPKPSEAKSMPGVLLEVIGKGNQLINPSAPYISIPTTAGTGAEVTRNAVLSSPQHRVKVSLRSPLMLPRLAVVDPQLTWPLPPAITGDFGAGALTWGGASSMVAGARTLARKENEWIPVSG